MQHITLVVSKAVAPEAVEALSQLGKLSDTLGCAYVTPATIVEDKAKFAHLTFWDLEIDPGYARSSENRIDEKGTEILDAVSKTLEGTGAYCDVHVTVRSIDKRNQLHWKSDNFRRQIVGTKKD